MGLETSTTLAGLDETWPTGLDPVNKGDDHLRLIKQVFKDQFPGVGGDGYATAILALEADLNNLTGTTGNIQAQIDAGGSAAGLGSIPIGGIIMYNGTVAAIPSNYQLCNGTNGTPDMTDRFVLGTQLEAEFEDVGGQADATLVSHTHSVVTSGSHSHSNAGNHQHATAGDHTHTAETDGAHTHDKGTMEIDGHLKGISGDRGTFQGSSGALSLRNDSDGVVPQGSSGSQEGGFTFKGSDGWTGNTSSDGGHTHSTTTDGDHQHAATGDHGHGAAGDHIHTINSVGSSATDSNLPPFLKLAFIRRQS